MGDVVAATADYERWVDRQVPTVLAARRDKHERMASGVFPFLRATYFRWVDLLAAVPAAPGPRVAAVGDLHVENFGTWRDVEGRLVWGVNDLDEAAVLPAVHDLLRLATSVELAGLHGHLTLPADGVAQVVLDGYARGLAAGGLPVVLEAPDPHPLTALLPAGGAARWWARILAEPELPAAEHDPDGPDGIPDRARRLLLDALPDGCGPATFRRRTAGLGSRDHLRLIATAALAGAPVVREVKARTPPATQWQCSQAEQDAEQRRDDVAGRILLGARRSPDPSLRYLRRWVVRRLAPWSDRIELTDLQRRADVAALLEWMGVETANVHLASASADELRPLTRRRARTWLAAATEQMVAATTQDHTDWCARRSEGGP